MKVLAILAALPLAVLALVPTATVRDEPLSLNPYGIELNPLTVDTNPDLAKRTSNELATLTNAQRLARGLPLKKPKIHRSTHGHVARAPTPSASAASGRINVISVASGLSLGYISKTLNSFGEFGVTDEVSDMLTLSFTAPGDGSTFSIGLPNFIYPFLGMTTGFANTSPDFGPGSFNYAYLTSTSETPSESPPVEQDNSFTAATGISESIESTIWTLDDTKLVPTWINTDGSIVLSQKVVYYTSDNVIILTGDYGAFAANFGSDNSPLVDLVLESM